MNRWGRFSLGVVAAAGLLILAACSSSNNNKNNNAGNATTSSASNTAAGATTNKASSTVSSSSTGAKLNDCSYAAKYLQALTPFANAITSVEAQGSPAAGSSGATAQLGAQIDKLNSAAGQVIATLQPLNLPDDLKKVNDQTIAAFQGAQKQLGDAKSAASAGDLNKATQSLDQARNTFIASFDKIQQDNKVVTDRLDACPSPTP